MALLIAAAWLARLRSGAPASTETGANPTNAGIDAPREHSDARVEVVEAPGSAAEDPSSPEVEPAPATLVVRVRLAPEDVPVAGARVRVVVDREERSEATSEAGEARWTVRSGARVQVAEVKSTASTTAVRLWRKVRCEPGTESVETVLVTSGGTLSGRVVDKDGHSVPSATVEAWNFDGFPYDAPPDRSTTADASGAFTLPHMGEHFVAAARAPGRCSLYGLHGQIEPGANNEGLQLVVTSCDTLRGIVVDESDSPVAGARVTVGSGSFSSSPQDFTAVQGVARAGWYGGRTTTDAAGRFTIDGLGGWCSYEASISHPEYLRGSAQLAKDGSETRAVLERGSVVRGFVLGEGGAPLQEAFVFARTSARRDDRTNEQGRFEITCVEPGRAMIGAHASGYAIELVKPFEVGDDTRPYTFRLVRGRRIAGRVVDGSGAPVADSRVRIEGDREVRFDDVSYGERTTWEWVFNLHLATTDEEGRFAFADLYDGTFRVSANDPRDEHLSIAADVRSGVEDLELRLDAARMQKVVLVGRAVDGLAGTPVTSFDATVMRPADDDRWTGRARKVEAPDGRFRMAGLEPGTAEIQVKAKGYAQWKSGKRELELGELELDVRLWPTRILHLRVVDGSGKPLGNTTLLTFRTLDGEPLQIEFPSGDRTSMLPANAGPVVAAGLPARPIRILAEHRGEVFEFDFDLRQPIEGVQELSLTPAPPRRLRLLFLEGPPPEGMAHLEPEGWRDLVERSLAVGPKRLPKSAVRLRLESESGAMLGGGACTPRDGGYDVEWMLAGQGGSQRDSLAEMDVELPGSVARALVTCEGFRDAALDLRSRSPEILRVVWLEK